MSNFEEKISELRIAQGKTYTLLETLAEKVDKYIDHSDEEYKSFTEFRIESSKHLVEVATIVNDMKKEVDRAVNTSIPTLEKNLEGAKAALSTHKWFIRTILAGTLLAVLGGAVTTVATCDLNSASAQGIEVQDNDTELVDGDLE